jgi:hypothetical protein
MARHHGPRGSIVNTAGVKWSRKKLVFQQGLSRRSDTIRICLSMLLLKLNIGVSFLYAKGQMERKVLNIETNYCIAVPVAVPAIVFSFVVP